ncbi:hypothetical protein Taro_001747 [Colocasia esculenta]|uniref:Uncharacterized protein n=1 Tax=Colocasia esculenta TaxID=4460 RepID=A0A843TIX5_COLES|nr:hypothetical protein [Colocasia esculenta]
MPAFQTPNTHPCNLTSLPESHSRVGLAASPCPSAVGANGVTLERGSPESQQRADGEAVPRFPEPNGDLASLWTFPLLISSESSTLFSSIVHSIDHRAFDILFPGSWFSNPEHISCDSLTVQASSMPSTDDKLSLPPSPQMPKATHFGCSQCQEPASSVGARVALTISNPIELEMKTSDSRPTLNRRAWMLLATKGPSLRSEQALTRQGSSPLHLEVKHEGLFQQPVCHHSRKRSVPLEEIGAFDVTEDCQGVGQMVALGVEVDKAGEDERGGMETVDDDPRVDLFPSGEVPGGGAGLESGDAGGHVAEGREERFGCCVGG